MSRGLERKEDKRDMGGGERQERRGKVRGEERGEEKREEQKRLLPPTTKKSQSCVDRCPSVNCFVVGGNNTARKNISFF